MKKKRSVLKFIVEGLEGLVLGPLIFLSWPISRHFFLNWGSTQKIRNDEWIGDTLVSQPSRRNTRSIEINASKEKIWPWIVQFGFDKAGFYSYELIERMIGISVTNFESIIEEYQKLEVGNEILLHPKTPGIPVARIELYKHICFGNESEKDSENARSWSFYIDEVDKSKCNLVVRSCVALPKSFTKWLAIVVGEPIDFIMEQRMLRTLKMLSCRNL